MSDSLGGLFTLAYDARDELTNEQFSGTGLSAQAVTYAYLCSGQPQLADFLQVFGRRVARSGGQVWLKAA